MAAKSDMESFIIEWLKDNPTGFDATSREFHDRFYERFGGSRSNYLWGALPVRKAMRLAAQMWREGKLERGLLVISEPPPGFSNWVYVYTLPEHIE